MTNKEAELLAATLGAPLFSSSLHMPRYQETRVGCWKLTRSGFCLDRGYYSGLWGVYGMPVLMRNSSGNGENWETWMSLSPHEIESQELGCRYAFGHTVVMGLGMGWVAVNIALNPAVHQVTVIECDAEVIDLFHHSRALDGLPAAITDKIRIVRADAMQWLPDEAVDFLYADIWLGLEEPQTLDDVRRMQANVQADTICFWGQELLIHSLAAINAETRSGQEWEEAVRRCVTGTIALPLLFPEDFDYPGMIAEVARRRRERWLNGVRTTTAPTITLRSIADKDMEFLYRLYASTRLAEMATTGWDESRVEAFLRMQFSLQHTQYMRNNPGATFDVVLIDGLPAGRLYAERKEDRIRIIDISLLPEFRGRGIGGRIMRELAGEADAQGLVMSLHVEINNPAREFYKALGFMEKELRGIYYYMER